MRKAAFTIHLFVSETERRTNYGKYKLHFKSGVGHCAIVLAGDSVFEE